MADPITAHGWRATRASISLVTTNRLSYLVVAPTRLCGDDEGPPDEAFAGLISCVEDAARLAEVRDVLTRTTITVSRILDYRSTGPRRCHNDACYWHLLNPEGVRDGLG